MNAHEKKMQQEETLKTSLTVDEAKRYLIEYGRTGAEAYIMGAYGVSRAVVRDYFTNHNIHQTKEISQQRRIATNTKKYGAGAKPSKPVIDKDLLQRYYVDEMIDVPDIVSLFDNKYTAWQIRDALSSYGIKRPAKDNPNRKRTAESIAKFKQTCLEKYGAENPQQSEAVKEKTQKTCMERYGVAEISKAEPVQQKRKETTMKHYGVENPFMSSAIQQKARNTQTEKYGGVYLATKDGAEAIKATKQARYGNPNYNNTGKIRQTKAERYNDPNYRNKVKTEQTCLERYGYANPMSSPEIRSRQAKSAVRNKFERRVGEFLTNNGVIYESQYTASLNGLIHTFDFAVYKDKKLEMLVDCDGQYYHGYKTDVDGKRVNNYSDDYRCALVPDGVKFLIILEGHEEEGYRELLKLYNVDYDRYLNDVFDWCREVDFPYPPFDETAVQNSLHALINHDPMRYTTDSRVGMKIVDAFHTSIWHANKKGRLSPYSAWQDDGLLKRCIKNRVIYKGHDLDRSKVLGGFSTAGIAPKVSVFTPYFAKYIIHKYLNDFDIIFDPCAGFSGRLLGAVSLGKRYKGQDINPTTVKESNDLINHFGFDNVNVSCVDLLKDSGKYDCLFTCPPYSDKEKWNMRCENKTCDEWIDECLHRYSCGRYVFVVDETEKYKDNITENITNKSHFGASTEHIIVIDR